jgi:hypothetical protein
MGYAETDVLAKLLAEFTQALSEFGWIEGRNLRLDGISCCRKKPIGKLKTHARVSPAIASLTTGPGDFGRAVRDVFLLRARGGKQWRAGAIARR